MKMLLPRFGKGGFQVLNEYIPGNLDTNREATAVLVVLMIAFETVNIQSYLLRLFSYH